MSTAQNPIEIDGRALWAAISNAHVHHSYYAHKSPKNDLRHNLRHNRITVHKVCLNRERDVQ